MYFPERIRSIKKFDRVLEIGPGNTPFYRSNVLLELEYEDDNEAYLQAGATSKINLKKEIIYYKGGVFPFSDNEFDYVICSHVLEHIPKSGIVLFINEVCRVSKKGYLEVPLYNFELLAKIQYHTSFININNNNISFLFKEDIDLSGQAYIQLQLLLNQSKLTNKIIQSNASSLVYGFEFQDEINYKIIEKSNDFFINIMHPELLHSSKNLKYYIKKNISYFNKNVLLQKLYNKFKVVI